MVKKKEFWVGVAVGYAILLFFPSLNLMSVLKGKPKGA